jgi:cytochrome c-type biogenesis protein CcmE
MSKGLQIAIGATAIAALFGWYGATTLEANASFTYYESLDDFHSAGSQMDGAHARVHGYVANESIRRDVAAKEVWFQVQNDPPHAGGPPGTTLEVVLTSLETPDLFKDGAEVVVEGILVANGSQTQFEADKVLAKCPSKFEAKAAESAAL